MPSAQSSTISPQQRIEALSLAVGAELELRRRKKAWKPTFRGASLEAQAIRDHEWMLAGPAETSKTWAACWRLDTELRNQPGAAATMLRKVGNDMVGTVLRTYETLALPRGGVQVFGGKRPEWYEYDNGSVLFVGGLDRPGKILSGERDWIYVNQAEQLTLDDWEHLVHRATGRGARTDHPMVFGDCNPDAPTHWIRHRAGLKVLESRHEDNPALYTDGGELTAQGERTMAVLDTLTGVRLERLRWGRWVAAEGVVYDGFDRRLHVIRREAMPKIRRWVGSIDWGYANPSVFGLWGCDDDDRLYLVKEIYRTQRLAVDFAADIKALLAGLGIRLRNVAMAGQEDGSRVIEAIVADHDAEDRATIHREGVLTIPAVKEIGAGIQKVQARLRTAGDGKPRIFFVEDSLVDEDAELAGKHLPTRTVDELEVYSWPKAADGRPLKEVPVDMNNHGCDQMRYVVEYVDRGKAPLLPVDERVARRLEEARETHRLPDRGTDPTGLYRRVMQINREEEARGASRAPVWSRSLPRRKR